MTGYGRAQGGGTGAMTMKKFINRPEDVVRELHEGYALAFPDRIRLTEDMLITRAVPKEDGKVGLVTLHGCGHEPAISGYVGPGLLDVDVPGEIFAAPGPDRCLKAIRAADRGAGVLFIVLNHEGDVLTGRMTMEMAADEGLNVRMVIQGEDISSAPRDRPEDRRGLVGFLPLMKIVGAAAEEGQTLDAVHELATQTICTMATLGVALRPCTHPATGRPIAEIPDDAMEIGMGNHGEPGAGRLPMMTADGVADHMAERLVADLDLAPGDDVLVLLSGSGATTLMELFIVFRRVHRFLTGRGIRIARTMVGEIMTTQEQAGFQMCLARMPAERLRLWDAPCATPYLVVT